MDICKDLYSSFIYKPDKNRYVSRLENVFYKFTFFIEDNPDVVEYMVISTFSIIIFCIIAYIISCYIKTLENFKQKMPVSIMNSLPALRTVFSACGQFCVDKAMGNRVHLDRLISKYNELKRTISGSWSAPSLSTVSNVIVHPLTDTQMDTLAEQPEPPESVHDILRFATTVHNKIEEVKEKERFAEVESYINKTGTSISKYDLTEGGDNKIAKPAEITQNKITTPKKFKKSILPLPTLLLPTVRENPSSLSMDPIYKKPLNTETLRRVGSTETTYTQASRSVGASFKTTSSSTLPSSNAHSSMASKTDDKKVAPAKSKLDQILERPVHRAISNRKSTLRP